jgi:hypothetical protein
VGPARASPQSPDDEDWAIVLRREALDELLGAGAPVRELLRPCIELGSGFWLDQMARTCFGLPDKGFEGEDRASLPKEIEAAAYGDPPSRSLE